MNDYANPSNLHSPSHIFLSTSHNFSSSPSQNSLSDVSDLEIPIAHRESYPIANYLYYHRLSDRYKAFASKIINLFVLRKTHEALNDLNWN